MKRKTTSGSISSITRSVRRKPGQKPDATVAAPVVPAIVPGRLHDVVNDTKSRAFCGPTAVAAITGEPVSRVRDAFRLVRYGAGWTEYDGAPAVTGTRDYEVQGVLRLFGYVGSWRRIAGQPTLAAWLEGRTGVERTHPCVVHVTGHYVATAGWVFCDTFSKGLVVDADKAPGRRKRVKDVFLITSRCLPRADIPTKATPVRPVLAAARSGTVADMTAMAR